MDEAIVPADYTSAGMLTDDDMFKLLIAPLPTGVKLTVVMDCCHSGTILDLPYTFTGSAAEISRARESGSLSTGAERMRKAVRRPFVLTF